MKLLSKSNRPRQWSSLECGDRSPLSDWQTCLPVSKRGQVRALPKSAFTMVEIALCLAIIGFALVAIIGVLPIGLNVQKENREETVITQEANYFMDAIRNGARGLDELTNNVVSITNYWCNFDTTTNPWVKLPPPAEPDGYTLTGCHVTSTNVTDNAFPLTNGFHIIGLLGRPKFEVLSPTRTRSNHVVAFVRAISGTASEKFPQTNTSVLDLGLNYRMVAEVHNVPQLNPGSPSGQNLRANLHEVRLRFSWPLLPGNKTGNGRQTFRSLAGGELQESRPENQPVFFFTSTTYKAIPPPP